MGFRDILEIHQLFCNTLRISMYTYPPEKKKSTNSSFLRCCRSCYLVTWLILKLLLGLAGWIALFKKRVFLTLNTGLQSTCLTDRLRTARWIQFELLSSQSVGQFYAKSGKWKLVFSYKNLGFKNLVLQRLRGGNFLGWFNWTMPHPGKILWTCDVKLCKNFWRNPCPTALQPDGTITNHKEIGLGRLLPSWFQEDIFARQVQVDKRELWRN